MTNDPHGHRRLSKRAEQRRRDGRARRRLALVTEQWLAELGGGQVIPLRPPTPRAADQHTRSEQGWLDPGPPPSSVA
jgi:hypothetical protein